MSKGRLELAPAPTGNSQAGQLPRSNSRHPVSRTLLNQVKNGINVNGWSHLEESQLSHLQSGSCTLTPLV